MDVANAQFEGSRFGVGDNIQYVCESGFVHTSGDLVRTCLKTEEGLGWNGTPPVCSSKKCASISS